MSINNTFILMRGVVFVVIRVIRVSFGLILFWTLGEHGLSFLKVKFSRTDRSPMWGIFIPKFPHKSTQLLLFALLLRYLLVNLFLGNRCKPFLWAMQRRFIMKTKCNLKFSGPVKQKDFLLIWLVNLVSLLWNHLFMCTIILVICCLPSLWN